MSENFQLSYNNKEGYDLVQSQQFQNGLKNSGVSVVLSEAPLAKLSHKLSFLSKIRKEAVTKLKYLASIW